jgi:ATP-dependent DNA ligase
MTSKIIDYQRKYASKYIPAEGSRLAEIIPQCDEYYYSEKLDGILLITINDGKDIRFFNSSGIELTLPNLKSVFPKDAIGLWAGELYVNGNRRSRPFLVSKSISNGNDDLSYAIFDIVEDVRKTISERIDSINRFFTESGKIHKIHLKKTNSRGQIITEFNQLVNDGSEGMVIHTPQGFTYKAKPQMTLDCVILGYAMRENGSQIRELLIGVALDDGFMVIGKVGTGFSDLEREQLVSNLEPLVINSNIVEVAGNGLAFYWVIPEFVVEVNCLELLIDNSEGPIFKQKVIFSEEKGYSHSGMITGVSLMSPVYAGIRMDKKADAISAGLSQITSRVEIRVNESHLKQLKASEIIKREVYIKEGKNGKSLRKFVSWKTNKEVTGLYPAYVLYFTDFSSGRKDPLQTEIYTAIDENELEVKFNDLIAENIKKGWVKI